MGKKNGLVPTPLVLSFLHHLRCRLLSLWRQHHTEDPKNVLRVVSGIERKFERLYSLQHGHIRGTNLTLLVDMTAQRVLIGQDPLRPEGSSFNSSSLVPHAQTAVRVGSKDSVSSCSDWQSFRHPLQPFRLHRK